MGFVQIIVYLNTSLSLSIGFVRIMVFMDTSAPLSIDLVQIMIFWDISPLLFSSFVFKNDFEYKTLEYTKRQPKQVVF